MLPRVAMASPAVEGSDGCERRDKSEGDAADTAAEDIAIIMLLYVSSTRRHAPLAAKLQQENVLNRLYRIYAFACFQFRMVLPSATVSRTTRLGTVIILAAISRVLKASKSSEHRQ